MAIIDKIDLKNTTKEVTDAIEKHIKEGYTVTNEKLTLLHNVPCFEALEVQSYRIDKELQKFVSERAAFIFEYAISLGNECLVCSTYFHNKIKDYGVENFDEFQFSEEEELLVDFARAIVIDPKTIPDSIYERLKALYNQEQIVILTTMAVFMIANNFFNDILKVNPAPFK